MGFGQPVQLYPKAAQKTPGAPAGNAGMQGGGAAGGMMSAPRQTSPMATPVGGGQTFAGAPPPTAMRPAEANTLRSGAYGAAGVTPPASPFQGPQGPGEGYGPGFGETYGQSHIGAYDQPTMLETFASQQMNGNNPYYDRLRQQQTDAINQQMAARGHYNSGGALAALGNADAALYAQQFQDMGNLLGNASNLQLNRTGAGFDQARGIQQQQQNRLNSQFSNLGQLASLGAGTFGGFYGNGGQFSGDAAMSGINAGANAGQLTGEGQSANAAFGMDILKSFIPGGGGGKRP